MTRPKKTTICPAGMVGVGGKWKFWIMYHLLGGTKRFGELQRLLPQASRQMLTLQLRELEQMGVLHRQIFEQSSPKVEYSLTELGRRLEPILRQWYEWGKWYCDQMGLEFDDLLVSLGSKWKFWIWYHLLSGPKCFGELQRLLPQVSRQILARQLRELEQMGALHRQSSPMVGYVLSELGRRSEPVLRQSYTWGKWYCNQMGLEFDWEMGEETEDGRTHAQVEFEYWRTQTYVLQ